MPKTENIKKKINLYLETFKNTKFVHIHAYKTSDTYNTTSPCMSPHYVTVSLNFVPGIPTISESVVVPSHCGSPPWRCSVLRCVWSPPWAWTAVVGLGAPASRSPWGHPVVASPLFGSRLWAADCSSSVSSVSVLFVVSLWSQCFISWPSLLLCISVVPSSWVVCFMCLYVLFWWIVVSVVSVVSVVLCCFVYFLNLLFGTFQSISWKFDFWTSISVWSP